MEDIFRPTWITSAATATMAFVAVALLSKYWRTPKALDVPILGAGDFAVGTLKKRYVEDAGTLLKEGYRKFNNMPFQVHTPDGLRLILPRRYAKELIRYNSKEVSNKEAISDRFVGDYTRIVSDSEIMHHAIGIDLNKNLGNFLEAVQEEIVHCLDTLLSSLNSDDWTRIKLFDIIQHTVAQTSARVFVGYPMCRSDEWRECNIHFARIVFIAAIKLKLCPPWLRPLAQYLVTEMWQIHSTFRRGHNLIKKELDRRAAEENGPVNLDMIEWMQQEASKPGAESCNDREFSRLQVLTAMVAIHTTSATTLHALYDLLANPQEYLEQLRAEMADVFKDQGKPIQKQDLTKLKKLDSFLKESQRHSPPSYATFERKLLIPITLSDGLKIPAGTIVQCNTNILEEAPASWGDPHTFDGFRFFRLREESEGAAANQVQFTSSTMDSMDFSYGKEACPGRFFASNLIKMILTHLLTNYDLKFGDSVVGRPKNPSFEVTIMTNTDVEVLAKKRVVSARS